LRNIAEGLDKRKEEVARTIALEAGKPINDARGEVGRAVTTFTVASEETKRWGGELMPLDITVATKGRWGITRRFPAGPVLGITPFNFPINLVAHKVAPALAVGNPIIIKPAEKTPLTALLLGEIMLESGWPEEAVNVVYFHVPLVEELIRDERLRVVSFTGSAPIGWHIRSICGSKKALLELGGNAAVIIDKDADLDRAAARCTMGAFAFSGQVCISVQRMYVHKNVYEPFMAKFVDAVKKLKMGDPLDETTNVGPLINPGSAARTEAWVNEAVAAGAVALTGGKREGNFFQPTILTNVTTQMKVCSQEAFAPLVTVTPFAEFDEALAAVNNSDFGLQAGLFSRDMPSILKAYRELEVGGLIVNDVPTFRVDNMPYGGVKQSGFGREGIKYSMEEMSEIRLMVVDMG
ncbi:MAG: aldehyde dehydrogenase family protein, partial [Nitrospirota bacterium]|nr:aldehyde dehydrogenase family protein [Nitrospirota bacterium]